MRKRVGITAVLVGLGLFGGAIWLVWSGTVNITGSPVIIHTTPPMSCDKAFAEVKVPTTDAWKQVITDYFTTQGLTVKAISPDAKLLDVSLNTVGEHKCVNPDGGESLWTGSVPKGSTAAVQVQVSHEIGRAHV